MAIQKYKGKIRDWVDSYKMKKKNTVCNTYDM